MRRFSFLLLLIFITEITSAQSDCLVTKQIAQNKLGETEFELQKTYNSEGKMTEEIKTVSRDYQGSYTERTVYAYNAKGYLSKTTTYHNGEFKNAKIKTYNNLGELKGERETIDPNETLTNNALTSSKLYDEKLFFAVDNSVSAKEITEKNENGQILKYEIRNGANQINHSRAFTYDPNGKKTYEKRSDLIANMIDEIYTTYSNHGQIEKEESFLNGKPTGNTVYSYAAGLLTEKTVYGRNNKLDYQILYSNNTAGNVVKESFLYQGRLMNYLERSYDNTGNLVTEKNFDANNTLQKTTTWEYTCP